MRDTAVAREFGLCVNAKSITDLQVLGCKHPMPLHPVVSMQLKTAMHHRSPRQPVKLS